MTQLPRPESKVQDDSTSVPRLTRYARRISHLLFTNSLLLPGLTTEPAESDFAIGIGLLLLGSIGVFEGVFAWLANPCVWCAWILMANRKSQNQMAAIVLSAFACMFSLSLLLYDEIPLASSSGAKCRIVGYGPSDWTWNACHISALVASIFGWLQTRRH